MTEGKTTSKQSAEEIAKKLRAELRANFDAVAKTPEGKKVLRWIMNYNGYGKTSMIMNPNTCEINTIGVVYNEARKDVYYAIRRLLSPNFVNEIEKMEE